MEGHGEKITRKQEQAIAALLSESSIGQAARTAGLGEKTLRGWLRRPAFQQAYARARGAGLQQAVAKVQQAASAAVDTLVQKLQSPADMVAVRAASERLGFTLKATELLDYKRRLEAIEARLNDQQPSWGQPGGGDPGPEAGVPGGCGGGAGRP